jgi:hypothetical protein
MAAKNAKDTKTSRDRRIEQRVCFGLDIPRFLVFLATFFVSKERQTRRREEARRKPRRAGSASRLSSRFFAPFAFALVLVAAELRRVLSVFSRLRFIRNLKFKAAVYVSGD